MPFNQTKTEVARAFNDGTDARLAGRPVTDCVIPWALKELRKSWVAGWNHCEHNWPRDEPWRVRPLPEVQEAHA